MKFTFIGTVEFYCHTTVEADTLKEAVELAREREIAVHSRPVGDGNDTWVADTQPEDPPGAHELTDLHVEGDATLGEKLFDRAAELWEAYP